MNELENFRMAWTKEPLRPLIDRPKPVDDRFAELLREVASGRMSIDEAWTQWQRIKQVQQ